MQKALISIPDRHSPDSAGIAQIARIKALSTLKGISVGDLADQFGSQRVARIVKAAVGGMSTSDSEVMLDRAVIVGAFIALLRNSSAFYRALDAGMVRVPFKSQVSSVTAGATAWVSAEGAAIPIARASLAGVYLDPVRAAGIIVLTEQLLRGTKSEAFLSRELRRAISAEVDRAFFAMVIDGDTPIIASAGADVDAMIFDLRRLIEAIVPTSESFPIIAMHPKLVRAAATAQALAGGDLFPDLTITGGSIWGVPVMGTDALGEGEAVAMDAAMIAGEAGDIDIDVSTEATLQMFDNPTGNSVTPTATALISLFQTNSVAIRATADFGAERLADNAVAKLEGAAWAEVAES